VLACADARSLPHPKVWQGRMCEVVGRGLGAAESKPAPTGSQTQACD
jgi:hypothetical protein